MSTPVIETIPPVAAPVVPLAARKNNRSRKKYSKIGWGVIAGIVTALWAFPVYWMIQSSLMTHAQLIRPTPSFVPQNPTLNNFRTVITYWTADGRSEGRSEFLSSLQTSLSITLLTVFFALIFAFLAAVAISRFKFRGRKAFIFAILAIQMLPAEGLFIAQYGMLKKAGETMPIFGIGQIGGVVVLYIAAVVPFTIWMLRGFVAGIPIELEEAAMVDGLTRVKAFMRITLPLLAPGLIAAGVFGFLQAWNEYTVALVVLGASRENKPLTLWLAAFKSAGVNTTVDYGHIMASSTLVAVPVIIFFMIVQGRMTQGVVAGAVKG